ncbi:hypothetical protein HOY80DRAFT_1500 [Tuber brumale]|nr:hypothetical protein HOY80DRAFT_1500 [Tuber brumale]
MCLISARDDDYPPARRVHVYREGRVTREYAAAPRRRSYISTSSFGGGRSSTVRHVYHSSPRGSWASTRETPGALVLSGRRGYY